METIRLEKLSTWTLLLLSMTAISCGKLPDYLVNETQNAFVVDAEANPNIDLLFVIDNSGSMGRDQSVLANSFQDFITNFTDKNLQYNIGVISTDTCPYDPSLTCSRSGNWWSPSATRYPGIFNQGAGGLLTKYFDSGDRLKFLSWDMDPIPSMAKQLTIERFIENSDLGTNSSGSEAPLFATAKAIERMAEGGYNEGFLRDDSFLAVIIVSDEDESYGFLGSPDRAGRSASAYLSGRVAETTTETRTSETETLYEYNNTAQNERVNYFLSTLEGIKGANLDNFSLNVIAVPHTDVQCVINGSAEIIDNFEPALTLHRAVEDIKLKPALGNGKLKASFTPICSDFSAALNELGTDIVEANARYALTQPPANQAAITVWVNGSVVTRSTGNGWEYDAVENAIQFYGDAVPSIGDAVSIDYVPGAPI